MDRYLMADVSSSESTAIIHDVAQVVVTTFAFKDLRSTPMNSPVSNSWNTQPDPSRKRHHYCTVTWGSILFPACIHATLSTYPLHLLRPLCPSFPYALRVCWNV